MNKNIYNGKFNILCSDDYNVDFDIPKNCNIKRGNILDTIFNIRQYELENDEIFSGNLILNTENHFKISDIFSQCPIDDNSVYVVDYNNSPHNDECNISEAIIYCGSFVLWLFGQYHRTNLPLFHNLRRNRIILRRFNNYGL